MTKLLKFTLGLKGGGCEGTDKLSSNMGTNIQCNTVNSDVAWASVVELPFVFECVPLPGLRHVLAAAAAKQCFVCDNGAER